MKRPLALYLVAAAFLLTWPVHIGAATFMFSHVVGEFFAPNKDHILFWFATLQVGLLVTFLLIVGMFMNRRFAYYLTAMVLFGGLWTLSRYSVRDSYDRVFEIVFKVAVAMLLVLSASYLLWRARYLTIYSHKKPVSSRRIEGSADSASRFKS